MIEDILYGHIITLAPWEFLCVSKRAHRWALLALAKWLPMPYSFTFWRIIRALWSIPGRVGFDRRMRWVTAFVNLVTTACRGGRVIRRKAYTDISNTLTRYYIDTIYHIVMQLRSWGLTDTSTFRKVADVWWLMNRLLYADDSFLRVEFMCSSRYYSTVCKFTQHKWDSEYFMKIIRIICWCFPQITKTLGDVYENDECNMRIMGAIVCEMERARDIYSDTDIANIDNAIARMHRAQIGIYNGSILRYLRAKHSPIMPSKVAQLRQLGAI
ncbi:hypothetical protein F-E9_17 [Faustovirus]|nr:hypothetical protein F-E9_17 [Faustovirus]